MDPRKLPFNALIMGPTNSGKTQYLINQLRGPFIGTFDYIVLFCPTFVKTKLTRASWTATHTSLWSYANSMRLNFG